jgi:hypothetical protein
VKIYAAFWLASLSIGLSASLGCQIKNCEHGSVCDFDDEQNRQDACEALCDRLTVCNQVENHDACMSSCFEKYDRSPRSTADACHCVERASCREIEENACPGAPVGGGGWSGGSGTGGASGTGGSGGAATGGAGGQEATGGSSGQSGSGGGDETEDAGAGGSGGSTSDAGPACATD